MVGKLWREYRLRMLLEGITSLMTHNPRGMRGPEKRLSRKNIPSPEEEAEEGAYRLEDGNLAFPAVGVRSSILTGASGLKIGRRSAMKVLASVIDLEEEDQIFPVEDLDGKPVQNYSIDTRRVVVQTQGVLRSRPKIFPWRLRCSFKLTLPEDEDADWFKEQLIEVVNEAGRYPGLGDGRPEKKKGMGLWFGKYKVCELDIEPL